MISLCFIHAVYCSSLLYRSACIKKWLPSASSSSLMLLAWLYIVEGCEMLLLSHAAWITSRRIVLLSSRSSRCLVISPVCTFYDYRFENIVPYDSGRNNTCPAKGMLIDEWKYNLPLKILSWSSFSVVIFDSVRLLVWVMPSLSQSIYKMSAGSFSLSQSATGAQEWISSGDCGCENTYGTLMGVRNMLKLPQGA